MARTLCTSGVHFVHSIGHMQGTICRRSQCMKSQGTCGASTWISRTIEAHFDIANPRCSVKSSVLLHVLQGGFTLYTTKCYPACQHTVSRSACSPGLTGLRSAVPLAASLCCLCSEGVQAPVSATFTSWYLPQKACAYMTNVASQLLSIRDLGFLARHTT